MVTGLSTDELATIRDGLAAGRKPRVQFTESAGQIAGQIGQVVSLDDPAVADEFVVVRFGRDELPFSPGDLRVAPRGAVAKKQAPPPPVPAPAGPPLPEFVLDKPVSRVASRRADRLKGEDGPVLPAPSQNGSTQNGSTHNGSSHNGSSQSGSSQSGTKSEDDVTEPAPRKAARPAKPKPVAALTVTLAYGDGEWTVAAAQGSKVLAKPYVVRPAEALRMVSLVDVPGVQDAVEQILSSERAEAQQQAERLRAELAEVEARLAELGEVGTAR